MSARFLNAINIGLNYGTKYKADLKQGIDLGPGHEKGIENRRLWS